MDEELDVIEICKELQESALKATKCSSNIPSVEFEFYNNFEKFNKIMKHQNNHSLLMLSSIIENENKGKKIEKVVEDEDKFDMICEINDIMFDRIGNYLDEASGLKKKDAELVLATINSNKNISVDNINTASTSSWNRKIIKAKRVGNYHLLSAKMIQRSQLKFKDKIVNSNTPFIPIIKEKPNSIKPLSILPEINDEGFETYSHPYEVEIEKFEPNQYFLKSEIPKMPKPVSETQFKYISTKDDLIELYEHLKSCKEIAVDLEHHSYRTFQGFTCLMQISTNEYDFIIDTLELRSEINLLNEIFTSPSILKVFHGADMDIVWLQRDFGIYVVNLFDTSQAGRLLDLPHLSLSYLLKYYCNLEADKKFQLADWRIRPLNEEMLKYAREDTHYLLFIYTQMKNELISKGNAENNLLKAVFDRSKFVCLKKYEKPLFHSESYKSLLKKSKANFNSKQIFALKELFSWRDRIARNEDESTGYVLPNHMLMHIAEVLPREQQGILSCCNPIPPLVKQQLNEIHLIILKARDMALVKCDQTASYDLNVSSLTNRIIDLDEALETRHDTFHLDRDHNLQTLIDDFSENNSTNIPSVESNSSSFINFFSSKKCLNKNKIENITSMFISPYEKLKLALNRRHVEKESKESSKKDNNNLNRLYSHYLKLTSDSGVKSESVANPAIQTNVNQCNEYDLSVKSKSTKRKASNIQFNSNASKVHKIEQKPTHSQPESNSTSNVSNKCDVKPFNYTDFDYSTFSAKNNTNTEKPSQKKSKKNFNRKANFKRSNNNSKSFTYDPNKKRQKF